MHNTAEIAPQIDTHASPRNTDPLPPLPPGTQAPPVPPSAEAPVAARKALRDGELSPSVAAALAWGLAGLGLMVILYVNTTAYAQLEGLAYLAAGLMLIHMTEQRTLAFWIMLGGAVCGLIDTTRLFVGGPSINLLVWLALECAILAWATLGLPWGARQWRTITPHPPNVADASYGVAFARSDGRYAKHAALFAKWVVGISAFYLFLNVLVLVGAQALAQWVGTYTPGVRDQFLGWFLPVWLGGLVSPMCFGAAAIGVLRGSTVARGCLLILASAKVFDWGFDLTHFDFGFVSVVALGFWIWGFRTLLPGGAAADRYEAPDRACSPAEE